MIIFKMKPKELFHQIFSIVLLWLALFGFPRKAMLVHSAIGEWQLLTPSTVYSSILQVSFFSPHSLTLIFFYFVTRIAPLPHSLFPFPFKPLYTVWSTTSFRQCSFFCSLFLSCHHSPVLSSGMKHAYPQQLTPDWQ